MIRDHDTIAAPATAAGGALAVIRISGEEALRICDRIFRGREPLAAAAGYTVHYGEIVDDGRVLDDVLVTVFRAPRSYTGEDAAEISCHGSQYIVSEILRLLTASGARMAGPGEFTIRAYLAGKLDLSQAEAVADIIASSSRAAHALAANQMRGGYSDALEGLCEKLLELTALLELELDFSEEEVEFADRAQHGGHPRNGRPAGTDGHPAHDVEHRTGADRDLHDRRGTPCSRCARCPGIPAPCRPETAGAGK